MNDEAILLLFAQRSDQAINEIDQKYGRICYYISNNILHNDQDAQECVNDAYLGLWNATEKTLPESLPGFLCRIVRNLSLMRYHANTAKKRNQQQNVALDELEMVLAAPQTVEDVVENRELRGCIERFLHTLSDENRTIFVNRYWNLSNYHDIAALVGLSVKNVSVRLVRMRRQMREYLMRQEVSIE